MKSLLKRAGQVARKQGEVGALYLVLSVTDGVATCLPKSGRGGRRAACGRTGIRGRVWGADLPLSPAH